MYLAEINQKVIIPLHFQSSSSWFHQNTFKISTFIDTSNPQSLRRKYLQLMRMHVILNKDFSSLKEREIDETILKNIRKSKEIKCLCPFFGTPKLKKRVHQVIQWLQLCVTWSCSFQVKLGRVLWYKLISSLQCEERMCENLCEQWFLYFFCEYVLIQWLIQVGFYRQIHRMKNYYRDILRCFS